jgi:hypothetical protein
VKEKEGLMGFKHKLRSGVIAGIKKALKSFIWICKIIIPVSLLVNIFRWLGWLHYLEGILSPFMHLINLPPEAGLPIITGIFLSIYPVIAVMATIPLTIEQMTLIAIFSLISHSLIIEGVIQHKSGLNMIKAGLIRFVAAVGAVLIVSQFFGDTSQSIAQSALQTNSGTFIEVIEAWFVNMIGLLPKVFGILMLVMIVLESLKSLEWLEHLIKALQPAIKFMGLSERTSMMCVVATIFGLMYGGAIIVEESGKLNLTKDELERLHIFIGINHAMIEDPALFAALGLSAVWMLLPRLIMAIIAVQIYRVIKMFKAAAAA